MSPASAPRPAKVRRSRAEQKEERTRELLTAAWELFTEKGYEAVTIDAVAERAGYSRMPIYTLFGDKQNLYFELWRMAVGELSRQLIGGFKPGVSLRRNLRELANKVSSGVQVAGSKGQASGEGLFFVVQTIALSRPDIAAKLEGLARKVVDDFAEAVQQSSLEPGDRLRADARTVAAHLVAHINGMATVQFQTHNRYDTPRDVAAIFTAIALGDSRGAP